MPGIRRRALIDLDAFAANLALRAADEPLDLRADAYGHGLALLGPVARDTGIGRVIVSSEQDAVAARRAGFTSEAIQHTGSSLNTLADFGVGDGRRAVMSLVGEVIAVKRVGAAAGVSYGYTYRTGAPTTLALIALGYADGVPRLASSAAPVLVGSRIHRVAGRIAMDQFVVDCGDDPPELGSDAVLFGDPSRGEPSLSDWAQLTQRSELDLTAGVGVRVERIPR